MSRNSEHVQMIEITRKLCSFNVASILDAMATRQNGVFQRPLRAFGIFENHYSSRSLHSLVFFTMIKVLERSIVSKNTLGEQTMNIK